MNYKAFQNIKLSGLGMGNMRLPSTDPKNPSAPIDYPEAFKIIRRAYEAGIISIRLISIITESRRNVWAKL